MTASPVDRQLYKEETGKEKDKNSRALRKRFRYNAAL
jgi:hypothetical protein